MINLYHWFEWFTHKIWLLYLIWSVKGNTKKTRGICSLVEIIERVRFSLRFPPLPYGHRWATPGGHCRPPLENVQLQDGHDEFHWNLHRNGQFSVASMYNALILPDVPIDKSSKDKLWKLKIPLWIKVFGWYCNAPNRHLANYSDHATIYMMSFWKRTTKHLVHIRHARDAGGIKLATVTQVHDGTHKRIYIM
jgi:hypothetical protein